MATVEVLSTPDGRLVLPFEFQDMRTGRHCRVQRSASGTVWVLYRHPDGQWVTWREPSEEDLAALAAAQRGEYPWLAEAEAEGRYEPGGPGCGGSGLQLVDGVMEPCGGCAHPDCPDGGS